MDRSAILGPSNVEILSNHLSRNSAKMVAFGTLVEAIKSAFPNIHEDNYAEISDFLLEYLNELGSIRPNEIALLSVAKRQKVRSESIVDQAVMWHGYLRLAARLKEYRPDDWRDALSTLSNPYKHGDDYENDLFNRENPVWAEKEVIAQGKTGPRVVNNRQSRQGAFEVLAQVTATPTKGQALLIA